MKICRKCGESFEGTRCLLCKRRSDAEYQKKNSVKLKAVHARYRSTHQEQIRTGQAKWYAEHREAALAARKKWYTENSARFKAYVASWQKANPGKIKQWKSAYAAANRAKLNAKTKKWWAEHPELKRIYNINRRSKQRGNGGKLSKGLAAKLFALQKGLCPCCGASLGTDYQLDHKIPVFLGGANEDWNMQLLRRRCNSEKNARDPNDFMRSRGFLL